MSKAALNELYRRAQIRQRAKLDTSVHFKPEAAEHLLAYLTPEQRAACVDTSKLVAINCTRRAGKTEMLMAKFAYNALAYEGSEQVYLISTIKQAKRAGWRKLKEINRQFRLGAKFNKSEMTVEFPNGSIIWFGGAENEGDVDKFRGSAFVFAALDEAAFFGEHIKALIMDVLLPALADHDGQLYMTTTPNEIVGGYFYDKAWAPSDSPWSKHWWSFMDNPHFPAWARRDLEKYPEWQDYAVYWLEQHLKELGLSRDDPFVRRNYFGEWVRDLSSLVYDYAPSRNDVVEQPDPGAHDWKYVIGVDLGFTSPTAFAVVGYHEDCNWATGWEAEKHTQLSTDEIGRILRQKMSYYGADRVTRIVVDEGGLGKTIARDLVERFNLPVVAAEKQHKSAFQATLNSDLKTGAVRIIPGRCQELISEWNTLQKLPDGNENKKSPNHAADAFLYAWRYCRHYIERKVVPMLNRDDPEDFRKILKAARVAKMKQPAQGLDQVWL